VKDDQLGLFEVIHGGTSAIHRGTSAPIEIEPAIDDEERELASRIPSFIRFGTSSWSFPGWRGLVWKGAPTEAELAKSGLAAYAQHPLFRTVGLDRTHYRPLRDEDLASYLSQLEIAREKAPDLPPFRVVSKVWNAITSAVRDGAPNPCFLDANVFLSEVLPPYSRVGATGPFVFEITPMPPGTMDERTFVTKLDAFLSQLPSGHRWAFELRNAELFTPRYLDVLAAHGAAHVFNFWTAMPSLRVQLQRAAAHRRLPRFVILRLMLPPFTKYETRKADFRPFDRIREIQSDMRDDVVQILRVCADQGSSEAFVLVNNKAEGSSPLTIKELAKLTIAELSR
jgi:uncharacterized protein YecE (DUF72 family)